MAKKRITKPFFAPPTDLGAPPPKSGAPRFFKPQGNSIIPKRKFVMTFQKKRARRGAARGESAAAVGGAVGALHALSAALSLRSVRRRGAAIFRRRVFAHKAFSLSGICARRRN